MGEMEKRELDLFLDVTKKEDGQYVIKDYENLLEVVKEFVSVNQPFVINNNQECRNAKEIRANYNKLKNIVKEYRITFLEYQFGQFQTQCKELETLFDVTQKAFGKEIDSYNGKTKIEKTTITLIYEPNEKIDKEISELVLKYPQITLKKEK